MKKHDRYNSCKRDNKNKLKQKRQENATCERKERQKYKRDRQKIKTFFFRDSSLRLSQTNTAQYE